MERILLVASEPDRRERLEDLLAGLGLAVVARAAPGDRLEDAAIQSVPDAVLVAVPAPGEALLGSLRRLKAVRPRPVGVLCDTADADGVRGCIAAGASACGVGGDDQPGRVRALLDAACAHFAEAETLRTALARANAALAERKLVERAKGIVMRSRDLDEAGAYKFLRDAAMRRNVRLSALARTIIEAEDLLN